jgi:hypothetical protein
MLLRPVNVCHPMVAAAASPNDACDVLVAQGFRRRYRTRHDWVWAGEVLILGTDPVGISRPGQRTGYDNSIAEEYIRRSASVFVGHFPPWRLLKEAPATVRSKVT